MTKVSLKLEIAKLASEKRLKDLYDTVDIFMLVINCLKVLPKRALGLMRVRTLAMLHSMLRSIQVIMAEIACDQEA